MERGNGPGWPPLEGDAEMTGSSLAPIVIPIVVTISLAAWIFMVYYAGSHPSWRGQATTPEQFLPNIVPEPAAVIVCLSAYRSCGYGAPPGCSSAGMPLS